MKPHKKVQSYATNMISHKKIFETNDCAQNKYKQTKKQSDAIDEINDYA